MKRPSDQAKLFFFGFLRTASALATSQSRFGAVSAASLSTTTTTPNYYYDHHHRNNHYNNYNNDTPNSIVSLPQPPALTLRIAQVQDVPSISACNLECLPENYNHAFYSNHMRQWPDLAIVAVLDTNSIRTNEEPLVPRKPPHLTYQPSTATSSTTTVSKLNNYNQRNHPNNSHRNIPPSSSELPNDNHVVVAYVLGKVEERPIPMSLQDIQHSLMGGRPRPYTAELIGHVTSLAVLEPYRRNGLAAELMNQLHYHMKNRCSLCGLHVRESNVAAARLYEKFGYAITETIPSYYQDGEDAYYMTRAFVPWEPKVVEEISRPGFLSNIMFGRRNSNKAPPPSNPFLRSSGNDTNQQQQQHPWECGPSHLRLPRPVGVPNPSPDTSTTSTNESDRPEDPQDEPQHHHHDHVTAEYMTGSM